MSPSHSILSGPYHVPFDASIAPALSIDSGDVVTFATLDACWNEVRGIDDFHRYRAENRKGSNPLTGPVFVRGAQAGGTLRVEILKIELDPIGFQLIGPQRAMVRDEVRDWKCHLVRIDGPMLRLDNGITLPIDPIIGELGNAPRNEVTNAPNRCGGNLDCPFIRTGATVYLPIEVDGALFSAGDVHARQGDGEIVGAPEISANITLRLSYASEKYANWPIVEDAENWHAVASSETEADAIRLAVFEAAGFLGRTRGMALDDAMVLLTMIAKIHCCRSGPWGNHGPVVAVSMPKALLPPRT